MRYDKHPLRNFWHQRGYQHLFLLLILGVAVTIRLVDLPDKWLWYDELQSVTHSSLPLSELLKSVRAFDPHPPFYFFSV